MPEIIVTTRAGEQKPINGASGTNLMQAIVESGIDELLALCGGVCSCATCHVHVDQAYVDRLEPKSEDEDELLSGSDHKTPLSRLACQVQLKDELDGMKVTIAAED